MLLQRRSALSRAQIRPDPRPFATHTRGERIREGAGRLPAAAAADLIKNEARLELKRAATGKTYRATLKPSKVTVSPVQYAIVPAQRPGGGDARVGYIRVVFFGANAFSDVKEAVTDLLSTGPPDAWILDLRANPGGIVYNGIEVSELFLEEGDVLCQVKYPREGEIEVGDSSRRAALEIRWGFQCRCGAAEFRGQVPSLVVGGFDGEGVAWLQTVGR